MKLHKPFNPDGDTLTTTSKIGDILDKGNFYILSPLKWTRAYDHMLLS